jgi:hypothetical protein
LDCFISLDCEEADFDMNQISCLETSKMSLSISSEKLNTYVFNHVVTSSVAYTRTSVSTVRARPDTFNENNREPPAIREKKKIVIGIVKCTVCDVFVLIFGLLECELFMYISFLLTICMHIADMYFQYV